MAACRAEPAVGFHDTADLFWVDRIDGTPHVVAPLVGVKWRDPDAPYHTVWIVFYVGVGPLGRVRQFANIWYSPKDEGTIRFCRALFDFINGWLEGC